MLSCKELIKYLGTYLSNTDFNSFLSNTFTDLSAYDVLKHDYMISDSSGVELGFVNEDSVVDDDDQIVFEDGNPIFSHFNLYLRSHILVYELPFGLTFDDKRGDVFQKAGNPIHTKEGDFLGSPFLIDHHKIDNTIISIDYNIDDMTIKSIQIRDNNLLKHLKV